MKQPGFRRGSERIAVQDPRRHLNFWIAQQRILFSYTSKAERGFALPIAIVAGLVLMIGVVALSSRTSQGFVSSVFQGANREARDVAESAIADFGVTMNREENRFLLVAGDGEKWTDIQHRNICTSSMQAANGTWSKVSPDIGLARSNSTPVTASRFYNSDSWSPLLAGDTARSFKVTKIEYLHEKDNVNAANIVVSRDRASFSFNTPSTSFPGKTVRESALQGGSRTLLRVTVVGRVVRNGQTSYARVAREFEVVPKCCKRSFGNNIGAIAWGRDNSLCPVSKDTGVGNGLIGSLNGGLPDSSNNELNIRNENNELITQALCWAGNESGKPSDLVGPPSADCLDGSQSLGKASKNKTSVSFLPTTFSFKLPDPKFLTGGRLAPQYGSLLTVPILRNIFPNASVGTWISDGTNYWVKRLVESGQQDWWSFSMRVVPPLDLVLPYLSINPVLINTVIPLDFELNQRIYLDFISGDGTDGLYSFKGSVPSTRFEFVSGSSSTSVRLSRAFAGCTSSTVDISLCRWELDRLSPTSPFPQVDPVSSDFIILGGPDNHIRSESKTYASNTRIYFDPNSFRLMEKQGSSTAVPLNNCVITKDPAAPYAVADCRFSSINAGNNTVTIDTSYAMINFHFDNSGFTGDYMGGNGNTVYQRVHCARSSWTPACNDPVTWADFQIKCDTALGSDPNCSGGRNSSYDQSELFNAFTLGKGTFSLNGTSSTVGINVYAPFASVILKGGGNADPNFMGRIWTDKITLNGNVKLRVPNSQPSFCNTTSCPPSRNVPLFDVVARSFSHASGF